MGIVGGALLRSFGVSILSVLLVVFGCGGSDSVPTMDAGTGIARDAGRVMVDGGADVADGGRSDGDAGLGTVTAPAPLWFADGLEYATVGDAIASGPWTLTEGDASTSTNYAHSGTRSLRIAYGGNEAQAFLSLELPGVDHFFCRWWELRERAGDFPGALDFDWSGEKFNRFRSASIGVDPVNGGLDYPLGWVAEGGWGQPGTQGGGAIQLFGNSSASNGANHWSHTYAMPRGEWHMFEFELMLGAPGANDGESRFWIDDVMVVEATGVQFRPTTHATIDTIWMGGWYSGGRAPEPAPAARYIDDVVVAGSKIGPWMP